MRSEEEREDSRCVYSELLFVHTSSPSLLHFSMIHVSKEILAQRIQFHVTKHAQVNSVLSKVLSSFLHDVLKDEYEFLGTLLPASSQIISSSSSSSSHCLAPRKDRKVSDYIKFCKHVSSLKPDAKNLQQLWKHIKNKGWKWETIIFDDTVLKGWDHIIGASSSSLLPDPDSLANSYSEDSDYDRNSSDSDSDMEDAIKTTNQTILNPPGGLQTDSSLSRNLHTEPPPDDVIFHPAA